MHFTCPLPANARPSRGTTDKASPCLPFFRLKPDQRNDRPPKADVCMTIMPLRMMNVSTPDVTTTCGLSVSISAASGRHGCLYRPRRGPLLPRCDLQPRRNAPRDRKRSLAALAVCLHGQRPRAVLDRAGAEGNRSGSWGIVERQLHCDARRPFSHPFPVDRPRPGGAPSAAARPTDARPYTHFQGG